LREQRVCTLRGDQRGLRAVSAHKEMGRAPYVDLRGKGTASADSGPSFLTLLTTVLTRLFTEP
jgi:hypothetical protein